MTGGTERRREPAAVLVPIYRGADGRTRVVLIRRTQRGVHGGQIAFPGGRREAGDTDLLDTALREAAEEIGLAREAVEVLAELSAVETLTSGFRIQPFLARVRPGPWRPAPAEVAEVLDVAAEDLLRPERRGTSFIRFPTWPAPRRIEYLRLGPHRLWGATYRILAPLLPRLAAGGDAVLGGGGP